VKKSPAPSFDLEEEYKLQQGIKALIKANLLETAHDVADGGLFVTLAESGMVNKLGFNIKSDSSVRKDAFLFGESQSRVVVSIKKEKEAAFTDKIKALGIPVFELGKVTSSDFVVDGETIISVDEASNIYNTALSTILS
jgi:phosphoribosylformylglycinamidine synthase